MSDFDISKVGYNHVMGHLERSFLSNLDLPQVDCVSAEGARDAREASECEGQQNRKRALRKSISNLACSRGSCGKDFWLVLAQLMAFTFLIFSPALL